MPLKIERYSGKGLSMFRAKYVAENYAAIRSADEAVEPPRARREGESRVSGEGQIFFLFREKWSRSY